MSMLLGKLYVDPLLSNFAVGYEPRGLITPQVLPVVDVPRQSGVYAVFEQADLFRVSATLRAPGTQANQVRFRVGSDTYFCTNYAVKTQVLLEEVANADAVFRMKLEQQRVAGGLTVLALDWENRLAGRLFNTANVGSSVQVASSWTSSASNPVGDLNTAIDNIQNATGYRPNTMVIGVEAWRALRRHPDVINKSRNPNIVAGGNYPAAEEVARLFELDRILVGAAYRNSAQEGQPQQLKPIWGPHALLAYMEYQQLVDAPTFGAAFRWVDAGVPNMQVERLPYDSRIKAQELEVGYFQDDKIVSKPLGFLVNSCV
jgi:hypothetical protein